MKVHSGPSGMEDVKALDARAVARKLGMDDGEYIACMRVEHAEDATRPRAQIYRNGWYCHKCSRGGDVIDLVARQLGSRPRGPGFRRAIEWLEANFDVEVDLDSPDLRGLKAGLAKARSNLVLIQEIAASMPDAPDADEAVAKAESQVRAAKDALEAARTPYGDPKRPLNAPGSRGAPRKAPPDIKELQRLLVRIRLDGPDPYGEVLRPFMLGAHSAWRDRSEAQRDMAWKQFHGRLSDKPKAIRKELHRLWGRSQAKWEDGGRWAVGSRKEYTWGTCLYLANNPATRKSDEELIGDRAQRSPEESLGWTPPEVREKIASLADTCVPLHSRQVYRKNSEELSQAISDCGIRLRYNTRWQRREIKVTTSLHGQEITRWEGMGNRHKAGVLNLVHRKCAMLEEQKGGSEEPVPYFLPARYHAQVWEGVFDLVAWDPVEAWIKALPDWDGTDRLTSLLATLFHLPPLTNSEKARAGANRLDLASWAGRYIFLGAVQRTLDPGCKLDEVPVLIGPQGCGKSDLLTYSLPRAHRDWFGAGLNFSKDTKVMVEALLGKLIVEATEMMEISRANIERLKAFITNQDDGNIRLSYARSTTQMPRRCVIVGTSNGSGGAIPNDPTGNRRFASIALGTSRTCSKTYMREHREQLWAQARSEYLSRRRRTNGEVANMPPSLWDVQHRENAKYRNRDDEVEDALDGLIDEQLHGLTVLEIHQILFFDQKHISLHRLAKALRNRGMLPVVTKIEGRRYKLWEAPGEDRPVQAIREEKLELVKTLTRPI